MEGKVKWRARKKRKKKWRKKVERAGRDEEILKIASQ